MRLVRKRLLIVDDDRDALESMKLLLETAYDVCLASSGADALVEVDRGFRPDAVLLDLMMPVMDGTELARELRNSGLQVPILVISGDPEAERKASEIGNVEILRKPFTYEQLKAKLDRILSDRTPKGGFLGGLGGFLGGLGGVLGGLGGFLTGLLLLIHARDECA